jgi:WD40 repeat protein
MTSKAWREQGCGWLRLLLLTVLLAACGPSGQPTPAPITVVASPTSTPIIVIASATPAIVGQATEPMAVPTDTPPALTPTHPPQATVTPAPTHTPQPTEAVPQAITPENATQVALLQKLGQGALSGMVLLPDGQTIAAAYQIGLYLYDAATLDERGFLPAAGFKTSLTAHPAGRYLVVTSSDGLQIWDLEARQMARSLQGGLSLVAFDAHGQKMATLGSELKEGTWQPIVAVWDTSVLLDGGRGEVQPLFRLEELPGGVSGLALSPDGGTLVTSGGQDYGDPDDRPLRLWDVATGQPLPLMGDLAQAPAYLKNLAFSPDGRFLAASDVSNILVWDVASGTARYVLGPHQSSVSALAFDADGQYLASGTVDGGVYVWSLRDGALVNVPPRLTAEVLGLAFLPSAAAGGGQVLVTATARDGVQVLDLSRAELIAAAAPQGPTDGVTALAYSPGGTLLAAASADETIWLWDASSGNPVQRLSAPRVEGSSWCACYWSLAFSPDGSTLAAGSTDAAVRLWDVATGNLLHTWQAPASLVYGLSYSADGRFLAAGDADGNLLIWDLASGLTALPMLRLDNPPTVLSISFSPDGKTLATGSGFGVIRIWDATSGGLLGEMQASNNAVRAVFSPDGSLLAAGNSGFQPDYAIRLWDPATGEIVHTLEGHTTDVRDLAFSPDGRTLASCDGDGFTKLWDVNAGRLLQTVEQGWSADAVAFNVSGEQVATGGFDSLVRIWGLP